MANSRRKEDGEIGKYDKTKSLFFQHTRNHRGCDDHFVDQILTNVTDRHLCRSQKNYPTGVCLPGVFIYWNIQMLQQDHFGRQWT